LLLLRARIALSVVSCVLGMILLSAYVLRIHYSAVYVGPAQVSGCRARLEVKSTYCRIAGMVLWATLEIRIEGVDSNDPRYTEALARFQFPAQVVEIVDTRTVLYVSEVGGQQKQAVFDPNPPSALDAPSTLKEGGEDPHISWMKDNRRFRVHVQQDQFAKLRPGSNLLWHQIIPAVLVMMAVGGTLGGAAGWFFGELAFSERLWVRVPPGYCAGCGCDLRNSSGAVCPECGWRSRSGVPSCERNRG
jgi:hypothetical protein